MVQKELKKRARSGNAATPRKRVPVQFKNPALGKLRKKNKLVKIDKIEKRTVEKAQSMHEPLHFVQKDSRCKSVKQTTTEGSQVADDEDEQMDNSDDGQEQ